MLEELLSRNEGKTLEFKENAQSLNRIVQTVIAFANTAGGTILLGIKDGTKEVIGLENILLDEERVANAIADSIDPLLVPTFFMHSWRHKDVLIINVPHSFGPHHLKSKGETNGIYVRLGSTNSLADAHTIAEIKRLKEHKGYDQLPSSEYDVDSLDKELFARLFQGRSCTPGTFASLELTCNYQANIVPTKGALFLFGRDRAVLFPDPLVRLVRFAGETRSTVLDHAESRSPLALIIDEILAFIRRHTMVAAAIGMVQTHDVPEYPPVVLREAVINAVVHADYSKKNAPIQVAIFDDRLEITNPGGLPFGLSMETALTGVSQLRNRVIGRVFKELRIIDQWGSGLSRMISTCMEQNIPSPKFQELDSFFRVTLFPRRMRISAGADWHEPVFAYLQHHGKISAMEAESLWAISRRTATTRLKKMCNDGLLVEIATNDFDPRKTFVLAQPSN